MSLARIARGNGCRAGGVICAQFWRTPFFFFLYLIKDSVGAEITGSAMRLASWVRLEAIADVLEELSRELRRLSVTEDGDSVASLSAAATSRDRPADGGFAVGRTVRVVIRDVYYGRVGRIVSRRGDEFWNLVLEADGVKPERLIYKKETSLQVI